MPHHLDGFGRRSKGRLEEVPGLGRKRIRAIRESLSQRLMQKNDASRFPEVDRSIPIQELLAVDKEYREKNQAGSLSKMAPSKLNPGKDVWLPILHTERAGRHYTALFSNTARAHDLNATRDWVGIYRDDSRYDGRWTVITSQFGRLQGRRIVRGREDECEAFYHVDVVPVASPVKHALYPEMPYFMDDDEGPRGVHG